ncbi:MAG: HD domain-containing protein [Sedimentisphaerales bacterium]|nr:HD domain-containing protein [Sedimentisphaerales bacterium]
MLRVPIEQASAGMVLARSVADPKKPEHILLKAGFELDEDHIKRLRLLHAYSIWVLYPGLDFLDELLDPELLRKQQGLYKSLKEQFADVQEQGLTKIDYNSYTSQMSSLFRQLLQAKNPSSLFVTELQGESDDIFLHGTTVASLAMLIGLRLEAYLVRTRPNLPTSVASDLTQLGVGCLLHDMGKLNLPDEIKNFHITAQNMGEPLWQQHTEIGFEMIRSGLDPIAGQVVLNHHQHFDGSGFPIRKAIPGSDEPVLPLEGEEIHIFCRIACIADRFDGFRHLPDGRIAPNIVALKRMKNPGYSKWFDPIIYEAFTAAMPAFAPGEQIVLNNGQTAVVTEVNEVEPCRPIVRPIDPEKAMNPDSKIKSDAKSDAESNAKTDTAPDDIADINLASRRDLYIARVGDFDVTSYLH